MSLLYLLNLAYSLGKKRKTQYGERVLDKKANSMGYTLIKEGVLVANLSTLESGSGRIVEVSDAIAAILKGTDKRFKVLTSVDRNRLLSAYKMVKN